MNIENVVDVQISVSQVVASATRFGHMLIVCPYPKTPGSATVPAVTAYSVASMTEEIKTAGFGEADPGYNAVQMLLKAKRLSDIVYIAVRQNTTDSVEDIALTMQRAFDYTSDFWAICTRRAEDFLDRRNPESQRRLICADRWHDQRFRPAHHRAAHPQPCHAPDAGKRLRQHRPCCRLSALRPRRGDVAV